MSVSVLIFILFFIRNYDRLVQQTIVENIIESNH